MSSEKKKKLFINFGILFIAFIFSLIAGELILRYLPKKTSTQKYFHKLACEYDPLLGWRKIPNGRGKHVTEEYNITEIFNSRGQRGPEYPYKKKDNEYRILILGDSFTEGFTVKFHQLFSEVLKKILNMRGDRYYEVINVGTGGYSTDQEFLFFQHEGKKYNPDLTIVMFYINDVWYNIQSQYWRGYKPFFLMEDGELILKNIPVPKPAKKKIRDYSRLYNFIKKRIQNIPLLYDMFAKIGVAEDKLDVAEFRVMKTKYDPMTLKAWEVTEAILVELKKETDSIGSKLVVFNTPYRPTVYTDEWEYIKKVDKLADKDWNIDRVGMELGKICKQNNISYIDPTKQLRTEVEKLNKKGKRLYYVNDGHWNIDGHNFVGEILAKHIH
jgi:hypothetical protein